jgi:hypothetical protein
MAARPMACAAWLCVYPAARREHILAPGDEARGGELVDERPIDLFIEIRINERMIQTRTCVSIGTAIRHYT